eukprot:759575-Pyramimonas_sp.AAC.1
MCSPRERQSEVGGRRGARRGVLKPLRAVLQREGLLELLGDRAPVDGQPEGAPIIGSRKVPQMSS